MTPAGFDAVLGNRRRRRIAAVVVLALVAVPFTTTAYYTQVVFLGLVFVLLGVSWNLLAGYAGQISLGHAAFFGIGAFVSAWVTTPARAGLPELLPFAPPVVVALVSLVLAALVPAVLALVVGPVVFRLSGHYFAIGTLALAAIVQLLFLDRSDLTGGSSGYFVQRPIGADAVYLLALVAAVGTLLVTYRIVERPAGLAMRAIHDDEGAASSLGVHPLKYKLYAFVVSSFVAGLAGGLFAQQQPVINAESTLSVEWTIRTLVVVILGGMGTLFGPVLGSALFLGIDELLRRVASDFATTFEGLLIILIIIFAPDGLNGLFEDYFGDDEEAAVEGAADDEAAVDGGGTDASAGPDQQSAGEQAE